MPNKVATVKHNSLVTSISTFNDTVYDEFDDGEWLVKERHVKFDVEYHFDAKEAYDYYCTSNDYSGLKIDIIVTLISTFNHLQVQFVDT